MANLLHKFGSNPANGVERVGRWVYNRVWRDQGEMRKVNGVYLNRDLLDKCAELDKNLSKKSMWSFMMDKH